MPHTEELTSINSQQFQELVIALAHRELVLGLSLSRKLDEDQEPSGEQTAMLDAFGHLQDAIYRLAPIFDMQDQFERDPDTGLLVVVSDSPMDQMIWTSVADMEQTIAYEMIVRHLTIEKSQGIRAEHAPSEPDQKELLAVIGQHAIENSALLEQEGLGRFVVDPQES